MVTEPALCEIVYLIFLYLKPPSHQNKHFLPLCVCMCVYIYILYTHVRIEIYTYLTELGLMPSLELSGRGIFRGS